MCATVLRTRDVRYTFVPYLKLDLSVVAHDKVQNILCYSLAFWQPSDVLRTYYVEDSQPASRGLAGSFGTNFGAVFVLRHTRER